MSTGGNRDDRVELMKLVLHEHLVYHETHILRLFDSDNSSHNCIRNAIDTLPSGCLPSPRAFV